MASPIIINNGRQQGLGSATLEVNTIETFSGTDLTIGTSSDTIIATGLPTPPIVWRLNSSDPANSDFGTPVFSGAGSVVLSNNTSISAEPALDIAITSMDNNSSLLIPINLPTTFSSFPSNWVADFKYTKNDNVGVSIGFILVGYVNNSGLPADERAILVTTPDDSTNTNRDVIAVENSVAVASDSFTSAITTGNAYHQHFNAVTNLIASMTTDRPSFLIEMDEDNYGDFTKTFLVPVDAAWSTITGWTNTGPWELNLYIQNSSGSALTSTYTLSELYFRTHPRDSY